MSQDYEIRRGRAPEDKRIDQRPPHPDETAPMIVNDISHLFHGKMRAQETEGVMSQHAARCILSLLSRHEGLRQTDIARMTHMKPPTVSVTLRKMMEEDLVRQETMFSDLRANKMYLTEKGKAYHENVRAMLHSIDDVLMRGFSEQESAQLCAMLNRMRDNLIADLEACGLLRPMPTPPVEDTEQS